VRSTVQRRPKVVATPQASAATTIVDGDVDPLAFVKDLPAPSAESTAASFDYLYGPSTTQGGSESPCYDQLQGIKCISPCSGATPQ
jgi:hypothetical protein